MAERRADRALVCAAEVATPLLAALVAAGGGLYDTAPLVDAAAAFVVERASDAAARGATPRGRLAGAGAAFGARATATREAIALALAAAELTPGAIRRLVAAPADAAVARAAGVDATVAAAATDAAGALAAAPLVALARLAAASDAGALVLACAGDDGGAASAVVVAT